MRWHKVEEGENSAALQRPHIFPKNQQQQPPQYQLGVAPTSLPGSNVQAVRLK
jgi:hypothetical protein